MPDTLTAEQRSERMSRVRAKDTKPEMLVRRIVHSLGYRFRLHAAKLPGRPDLMFARKKVVIFVHGCFWHGHLSQRCKLARMPKSNKGYWVPKIVGNRMRDKRNRAKLLAQGWRVLTVWECQTRDPKRLRRRISKFLSGETLPGT